MSVCSHNRNKVDLIREAQADEHHQQILDFVRGELARLSPSSAAWTHALTQHPCHAGTVADNAPIVPISAQLRYNVDAVIENICKRIPVPVRDFSSPARLIIIRSFDVNKPGFEVDDLKGGVAGGSILTGVLRLGQEIELRPGLVTKDNEGRTTCKPIYSRIVSLFAEKNQLEFAVPGGLIGVGTKIDPQLCRADRLVGQVLGAVGTLPSIYLELEVNYFLLRRLLGVKTDDKKQAKVGSSLRTSYRQHADVPVYCRSQNSQRARSSWLISGPHRLVAKSLPSRQISQRSPSSHRHARNSERRWL